MAMLRLVEVMRRDQHGHALAREIADQVPEAAARQRIDAAGWFVEEHDLRLMQDRAAKRQPLPPAAGQLARERVFAALEAGDVEHELPPRGEAVAPRARRCRRRTRCSDRPSAPRRARTSATCSRLRRFTPSGSRLTSMPPTSAVPDVGFNSPHNILMVVDLPAPLAPRKPKISPCLTENDRSSTATKAPKRRRQPAHVDRGRAACKAQTQMAR